MILLNLWMEETQQNIWSRVDMNACKCMYAFALLTIAS